MVPQIDEKHVRMLARAINPARNTDFVTDIGSAQLGASVRTIFLHGPA